MGLVLPIVTVFIFNNPFRRQKSPAEAAPAIETESAESAAKT
jgi:hypothetical protein